MNTHTHTHTHTNSLLCLSVDMRLFFYPEIGDVTVGIRAQVAIPGTRMII